ncbi:hypothetical protein LPW11_13490 [Geomonas sp. RF6]|uniref:hypothetical protein n=1 Tax=Geomonas sp. RF6 TaxID=2897342 RepID=UPI001E57A456|nr:hypothetical protein [Geomonas sp. RF6]UFS68909.1 hypothetical protein LPW11_13490 [Geomonas sp. RF6]
MIRYCSRLALLASIACFFSGCATLPHSSPLPQGSQLRKISPADSGSPFSLQEGDGPLAFSDESLQLLDLKTGTKRLLAKERPIAVAISAFDKRVAAAFPAGSGSIVRIYDAAGKVLAETTVGGRVTSIVWRNKDELVLAALSIKKYSFGAQLDSILYRWDGIGKVLAIPANGTTVRPYIAKMPDEALARTFAMALSPYGDEVALTKLKDPPNFTPFLQIFTHHLDSSGERQIGEAPLGSGGPVYAPGGEKVLMGNADGEARWIPLSGGKEAEAYRSPGTSIALSPSGTYALVDGHLYRERKEVTSFPPGTTGVFSSDGSVLVLRYRDAIYLLTGINDSPAPALSQDSRLMELRRLRSKGLITQEELEKARGKH